MGSTVDEPNFGRRLIPTLIDENAYTNPNGIYCFISKGTEAHHGFESVTFNRFACAIDRCSHWMEAELGRGQCFNTVAYLGPSDLLTSIIIVAAIKTGHKALLASPRNSLHAHINLLDSTQCRILITPAIAPPVVKDILSQRQMRHVLVPSLQYWLLGEAVSVYTYDKTFEEARYEPFVVVHTSGSTGLPKPVIVTHGTVSGSDAFNVPPSDTDSNPVVFEVDRNKIADLTYRCSQKIAGINYMLSKPFYYGVIPVLAPPNIPVTAQLADAMHNLDFIECSIVAPSILQEIAETPSYLGSLRRLRCVMYGGGPLAKGAGDKLRSFTNVYNLMGGSEMYCVASEIVDQEDWEYLKFSPMMGTDFRYHSEALWELCFVKEPMFDLYQSIFATYPELQEYRTNDLYSKHPTKSDLWRYEGRADDIIALSNGEKFNPIATEGLISAHPDVKSVLIFGQGRFQPGLLVEATMHLVTNSDRASLKESMWQIIAQANNDCEAHGRLSKDIILFTDPSRPFLRAGKGTVQRRLTLDIFDQEIEQLYATVNNNAMPAQDLPKIRLDGPLRPWLRRTIMDTANWKTLKDEDDFFALGMDSLQVLDLVRQMNSVISADSTFATTYITAKVIYANPTIKKLAIAIQQVSQLHKKPCIDGNQLPYDNLVEMQALLSEYSRDLPELGTPTPIQQSDQHICVLITGSTGSIGSYVLDSLIRSSKVYRIYCLNRSVDSEMRQLDLHSAKGLSTAWNSDRVTFLPSRFSEPNLGLTPQAYEDILANVTHILHNAWPVDFNLPLSSFAPHLHGVRQFIDFCSRSPLNPAILFVSSISAAMDGPNPVPERILTSFADPAPMAYAQSKHLAERLLDAASSISGIKSVICRVGQVAGPVMHEHKSGIWNKQEWLPSLIASSKHLGKIPKTLGPNEMVDWIPVDVLSRVLIELLLPEDCDNNIAAPKQNGHLNGEELPKSVPADSATVYHAVNPRTTPWSKLLPTILASFHDKPPELVTLCEWVTALGESAAKHEDLASNPAVKLLDFFEQLAAGKEDMVRFETINTVRVSATLKNLEAVKVEWMEGWMRQWGF